MRCQIQRLLLDPQPQGCCRLPRLQKSTDRRGPTTNALMAKVTHRLGRFARFQFSISLLRMATESVTLRRGRVCSFTPGMPKVEPCFKASSQVKQMASFAEGALEDAASNVHAAAFTALCPGGGVVAMPRL